jgi:hypothetical protein
MKAPAANDLLTIPMAAWFARAMIGPTGCR